MKKIFTLIAVFAMTTMANAQLHFQKDGKNIENGATLIATDCDATWKGLGFDYFTPEIHLVSDVDANEVSVTVTSLDGKLFQFCFGGECQASTGTLTKTANMTKNTPIDLQIENGGITDKVFTGVPTTYKLAIKAFYKGKESEAITMTLYTTNDPEVAAIEGITSDDANAPVKEYNVGGRTASGKGLSIIKRGKSVKKIIK